MRIFVQGVKWSKWRRLRSILLLEFSSFGNGCLIPPGVALWRSVACLGWLGRRSSKDSRVEEELLEFIEFAFEENDVEGGILRAEVVFDVLGDQRMFEDSSVRCFGLIIATGERASGADFFLEFHDREEEVVVEAEPSIECV